MTTEKVKEVLAEHNLAWNDFVHWFNKEERRYTVGAYNGQTLWNAKDIEDFINTTKE